MNQHELDDLRRAAERAGRGESVMVDAELALALVALANNAQAEDPMELAKDAHKWGFEQGWEACADSIGGPRGVNAAWLSYKSTL